MGACASRIDSWEWTFVVRRYYPSAMDSAALNANTRALLARCKAEKLTIATAESCTGGLIAAALTAIPGSSAVVDRGFVTYSNEAKTEMLGVPADLIARRGAVSADVARAMAEGALRNSRAQVSLAITGVAGPGGGTETKPVGMVSFAWSNRLHTSCETVTFKGDREQIRGQAAAHALRGLLALIDENER